MMVRLMLVVLGVGVVMPAMLGFAASMSIEPIVSQEIHVPVGFVVTTEQIGGPAPAVLARDDGDPGANDALTHEEAAKSPPLDHDSPTEPVPLGEDPELARVAELHDEDELVDDDEPTTSDGADAETQPGETTPPSEADNGDG